MTPNGEVLDGTASPLRAGSVARALATELVMSITAANVLVRRGHTDPQSTARFLDPKLAHLTPPDAMRDRDEAVARIARAVRARERVCVFGDYDADGVTSAALLTDVLARARRRGRHAPRRPVRRRLRPLRARPRARARDGRDPARHVRLRLERPRAPRARAARGIDVVVIDHHRVPDEPLPVARVPQPAPPRLRLPLQGPRLGRARALDRRGRARRARRRRSTCAAGSISSPSARSATWRRSTATTARSCAPASRARAAGSARARAPSPRSSVTPRARPSRARTSPSASRRASTRPGASRSPTSRSRCSSRTTRRRGAGPRRRGRCASASSERSSIARSSPRPSRCSRTRRSPRCRSSCWASKGGTRASSGSSRAGSRRASASPRSSSASTAPRAAARCAAPPASGSTTRSRGCADASSASAGTTRPPASRRERQLEPVRERFAEACLAQIGGPRRSTTDARPMAIGRADAVLEAGDDPARVLRDLERFEPCGQANPAPRVALAARASCGRSREVKGGHLQLELDAAAGRPSAASGARWARARRSVGAHVHVVGALRRDTLPRARRRRDARRGPRARLTGYASNVAEALATERRPEPPCPNPPGRGPHPLLRREEGVRPEGHLRGPRPRASSRRDDHHHGRLGQRQERHAQDAHRPARRGRRLDPLRRPTTVTQDERRGAHATSAAASPTSSRAPRSSTRSPSARTSPTACASSSGTR